MLLRLLQPQQGQSQWCRWFPWQPLRKLPLLPLWLYPPPRSRSSISRATVLPQHHRQQLQLHRLQSTLLVHLLWREQQENQRQRLRKKRDFRLVPISPQYAFQFHPLALLRTTGQYIFFLFVATNSMS